MPKCSDISTIFLLRLFAIHQGQWAFWHDEGHLSWGQDTGRAEAQVVPSDFPRKVLHAKFKKLIKKGYLGGCECGCRGDFEITDKGLAKIGQTRIRPYNGY